MASYQVYPTLQPGDLVTTSESYDAPGSNWLRDEGFILGEVLGCVGLSVKVSVLIGGGWAKGAALTWPIARFVKVHEAWH